MAATGASLGGGRVLQNPLIAVAQGGPDPLEEVHDQSSQGAFLPDGAGLEGDAAALGAAAGGVALAAGAGAGAEVAFVAEEAFGAGAASSGILNAVMRF